MFPIYSFEPERGLVVHLDVGIHVVNVVVWRCCSGTRDEVIYF
jgi:hypothetical protein